MNVLRMIISFSPYLSSAMVRFPLCMLSKYYGDYVISLGKGVNKKRLERADRSRQRR